jgi:hypothetical protein
VQESLTALGAVATLYVQGHFFTRRSANVFIAVLLTRYNGVVESGTFPKGDGVRPSPGVVTVGRGEDLELRITPRG